METQKDTTTNTGKTFATKTGFCHVLPDKIVLTRDGIIGNIAEVSVGNNIARPFVIYGVLSLGLFFAAFESYRKGNLGGTIVMTLFGVYLLYGILTSLNNSATPVIDREKIKAVKFKKAIKGFTRSRFEVFFEDEKGKIKKRLILLPGSLSGDPNNETDKALRIMREEGMISNI